MSEAPKPRVRERVKPAAVQPVAAEAEIDTTEGLVDLTGNPLDNDKSEIADVLKKAQKRFGNDTIFRASTRPTFQHVSTGVFTMDLAMLGGIPKGLVTLYTGWQHSGKTTFASRAAGQFQRALPGTTASFVDIEGTYDPLWSSKHGVDNESLLLVQPSTGEDACDLVDAVIRARETSIVILDSVAGLIPLKEIEASTEDSVMGKYAILVNRFCRRTQQAILDERKRGHWVTVLLTNQYRMSMASYGDPRVLPGGKATPYLASYWYSFRNKEILVDGKLSHDPRGADMGTVSHNEHAVVREKNKLGGSKKEVVFEMVRNPYHPLGEGFIDEAETVLTEAKKRGFILGSDATGAKPPYRIKGLDEKFKSLAEMVHFCYSDLDFYEQFKVDIISHERAIRGMEAKNWRASA